MDALPVHHQLHPVLLRYRPERRQGRVLLLRGQGRRGLRQAVRQVRRSGHPAVRRGLPHRGQHPARAGRRRQGIYSVLNYAQDLDGDANRKFVADWTAKHDTQPTTYAMASYDAALVLDQAIADAGKKGGEVTPERINEAIGDLGQIDSPRGPWEFNEKTHAPVQKWYLRQVRPDGKQLANVMVQDLATLGG
ncbi:ABC transporter substrate-binding protein [Streptomyces sp. M19]